MRILTQQAEEEDENDGIGWGKGLGPARYMDTDGERTGHSCSSQTTAYHSKPNEAYGQLNNLQAVQIIHHGKRTLNSRNLGLIRLHLDSGPYDVLF